jgi:kumamolisin
VAEGRVPLPGSHRLAAEARRIGDPDPTDEVEVTITLRKPQMPDANDVTDSTVDSMTHTVDFGADADDAAKVKAELERLGLQVYDVSLATRSMHASGTVRQLDAAFGVTLGKYENATQGQFRGREGSIHIPVSLEGIVTGVFGLDDRRMARHGTAPAPASAYPLTPPDLESHYRFPAGDAAGQVVAIAEFGGAYFAADVQTFCQNHGRVVPVVTPVSVGYRLLALEEIRQLPQAQQQAVLDDSVGVTMDVEIVAALCPAAQVSVYFAPPSQKGWVDLLDAVMTAQPVAPVALSISWGLAEDSPDWSGSALREINQRLQALAIAGVTVCAAAGGDGAGDQITDGRAHVNFPAASPFVLSVGGTMLTGAPPEEVVWWEAPGDRAGGGGSTGGGVSTIFARPAWQTVSVTSLNQGSVDGRVVPDVAALAGPPYYHLIFRGQDSPNGGTSAATALWTALLARIAAASPAAAQQLRFLTPLLYGSSQSGPPVGQLGCTDITSGNNSSPGLSAGYQAGPGYDAVTGWGTPIGTQLQQAVAEMGAAGAKDEGLPPRAQLTHDSWTTDDKLGYKAYADAIAAFICHPDTKPPLTIGIKGPWGAGKTSLMRMVELQLDPHVGGERQKISLTADSREKVSPPRWRLALRAERDKSDPPRVSNREVFKKARQPAGTVSDDSDPPLHTDPPQSNEAIPNDDWRPTVWFNPWMFQTGEQIWAGFAYEIIRQITHRLPPGDRERFWLRLNLARLDRDAVRRRAYRLLLERLVPAVLAGIAVVIVTLVFLVLARVASHLATALHRAAAAVFSAGTVGVLAGAIFRSLQFGRESATVAFGGLVTEPAVLGRSVPKDVAGLFTDAVPDPGYQTRVGFLHLVNTDMRRVLDLVATPSRPLVVFVDDLDRCSPGPVVQVIEAINLFLAGEYPNCIFVLAMEPDVVAADIEVAYKDQMTRLGSRPAAHGWDTLGWRFLEKIVQLPLSLPPIDEPSQITFVRGLLNVPMRQAADSSNAMQQPASRAVPHAERVKSIETKIRAAHPDLDSLPQIAYDVQTEVLGASEELADVTRAAVGRVFADLYSDQEANQAIESALPGLGSSNPREIKRYVNLFRFYTFIAYRKRLDGRPAIPAEEIAKLAVLTIRWPDLLGVLMRAGDDGQTNLKILAKAAEAERSAAEDPTAADAWKQALCRLDVDSSDTEWTDRWELLHSFLASGPDISEVASQLV